MRLDLGEFEVRVVGVHGVDLFTRRRADYLDNFNELVNVGLTRKDRCAEQHFSKNTTKRPHVNRWRIIGSSKYQLGCAIISAANVRNVGLALDELLRAEKRGVRWPCWGLTEGLLAFQSRTISPRGRLCPEANFAV